MNEQQNLDEAVASLDLERVIKHMRWGLMDDDAKLPVEEVVAKTLVLAQDRFEEYGHVAGGARAAMKAYNAIVTELRELEELGA
jgi:hypothetical protein